MEEGVGKRCSECGLRPDQLKFVMETAVLLHDTHEENSHPKSANRIACTLSTISGQLASLLGVPFNFRKTSHLVQFCS